MNAVLRQIEREAVRVGAEPSRLHGSLDWPHRGAVDPAREYVDRIERDTDGFETARHQAHLRTDRSAFIDVPDLHDAPLISGQHATSIQAFHADDLSVIPQPREDTAAVGLMDRQHTR